MGASHSFDYDSQLHADRKLQSIEAKVEGDVKGETVPRRNVLAKDGLLSRPFSDDPDGGCKSMYDIFARSVRHYPDQKFLGTRKYIISEEKKESRGDYIFQTYQEVYDDVQKIASGLVDLGAEDESNIGIFSNNCAEWVIAALANYSMSFRTVSLYATLGTEAVQYICNHASTKFVFVSKENIKGFFKSLDKIKDTVKFVIQFDHNPLYGNVNDVLDEADVKKAADAGIQLISFSALRERGAAKLYPVRLPNEDTLAMIMYTSGTTGDPKGVLLTHGNINSSIASVPSIIDLDKNDRFLSYLPLAHIFESIVEFALIAYGGSIYFYQGNVRKLTDDIVSCRPTVLAGVPRVFQRIHQKVFEGVSAQSFMTRFIFNRAYAYQGNAVRVGGERSSFYDKNVFIPLRTRLGLDQVKLVLTGAAPSPAYLIEFLKIVIGSLVSQGYGMTETAAASTVSRGQDPNLGHCGPPLPCCEIKLVDIPDMNYLSTDPLPRGEIWVRGPCNFKGYYRDENATKATLIDGWVATGDVGRWNKNGTLSVIDRKKNMFKLAQGEYVAAERIEAEYGKSPLVGQVWLYGNSFKSLLMLVVVPAAEPFSAIMKEKGWWPQDKADARAGSEEFSAAFASVCSAHAGEVKAVMIESLRAHEKDLKGFEKFADIIVEGNIDNMLFGFSEANGLLTPTFKLRRPNLLARYKERLREMYAAKGEPDPKGEVQW